MIANQLGYWIVLLSIPIGMLSFIPKTLAQQETKLTISPVTFELSANPGDTLTNQIKVTNVSPSALQLETRIENIARTDEQGQVELTEEATSYAISTWVSTNPQKITVGPREEKIINFTIQVPTNAEPGGHYGTLLVGTVAGDINGSGASIVQRIGSLLLVRVSGEANELALVTNFSSKQYSGRWEEVLGVDGKSKVLRPKGEKVEEEKARKYYQNGPLAFDVKFHNNGNAHIKPIGFITIYNIFNRKIGEVPLDAHNVFPGADRRITSIWPQQKLWGIYYRAKLVAIYGANNNKTLSADTTFWAFPLWAAITLGTGVILLLVLRKRLLRALRILIRGR